MAKVSYIHCGLVGSAVTLAGFIISAIGFKGVIGEGYSL